MKATERKQYLTPRELGARLKLGRNKVYELIKEPGFPAYRIGTQYRIPEDKLEEWLTSTCRKTGGENI